MKQSDADVRPLHILIPKALHGRLKVMAEVRDRSVAAETRRAIEQRLSQFEADRDPAEPKAVA